MTTLNTIHDIVRAYNRQAAPGSECNAWQNFVSDTYSRFGIAPWNDGAFDIEVPKDFADYWSEVAAGESADYDAETGTYID